MLFAPIQQPLKFPDYFAPVDQGFAYVVRQKGYRPDKTVPEMHEQLAVPVWRFSGEHGVRGWIHPGPSGMGRRDPVVASDMRRRVVLPFVQQFRLYGSRNRLSGWAEHSDGRVHVVLLLPSNRRTPENELRTRRVDLESILRGSLAVYAGADLESSTVIVRNRFLQALKSGREKLVRVSALPGIKVQKDSARTAWSVKRGPRELLLPLGSDHVRVGDRWRRLNRVLPLKDGSLYVPLDLARWIAGG